MMSTIEAFDDGMSIEWYHGMSKSLPLHLLFSDMLIAREKPKCYKKMKNGENEKMLCSFGCLQIM
jgi:hypothetical protein